MGDVIVRLLLESDKYDKALKKAEKSLRNFSKQGGIASKALGSLKGMFAAGLAVAGVSTALGDIVQKTMEFEKAISSLSSLTGLVGDDLNYLRQQAIILGATTTQTATQVADAFKLIGSQQPQLLESKEALVAVTRSAITLAEASETDVPTAAKALSGALNQMGAGAEYAQSYINILAAASQKGSADIGYLNKAVEKSGGTANAVGIKFNELVASIETIAPKVTEASEAGTQLRNIFIKLESSTDKNLKPSVVGLGGAIDNLAKQHLTAGEMAKKFGVENVNAALALTKSKDTYHDLETAITGTNTAMEQATTNTDNLAGATTRFGSAWEGLVLTLNKSDGVLKNIVDWSAEALDNIRKTLMSAEALSAENVAKGSSDIINKSFGNITKRIDGGTSRSGAYELEIIKLQDRRDIEAAKLARLQKKAEEAEAHYHETQRRKGRYNRLDRGFAVEAMRNARNEYTQQQDLVKSYDAAIQALKKQKLMDVSSTGSGGTGGAGGTGGTGGTSSGRITPKSLAKVYPVGSLGAYQAELTKLNEELNSATTTESRQQIQAEIDSVQRLINAIKELNSVRLLEVDDRGKIVDPDMDLSYKAPTIEELTPLWGPREMMTDLKTDVWGAEEYLEEWRKATLDMDPKPIEEWGAAIDGVSAILSQSSNEWVRMASTALNVIGQIIQATATGGINAGGGFGLFGSLISLFGGAFADGGIVGGQRYNDGIVARVSSGEMIINQADQKRLFNSIRRGESGGGGMVRMTLRGEDLISAINNYGSRSGQGKIKFER